MSGYRTALSRARGLGSAKTGVEHWLGERITSIALVPLSLWGVWAVLKLAPLDYDSARGFVAQPVNAILILLFLAVAFQHMKLGLRVVVEDYIHKPGTKFALLLLNSGVCWTAWAAASFCILKTAFAGGGVF